MNCYTTNTSVTSWNHSIAVARIPFNIILGCLLLIGLIGNSVAIHVCRLKQKRGNRFYIMLLAIFDILTCVTSTISIFLINANSVNFPSDAQCKIQTYVTWVTPCTSALMILVIALQRFLLVYKPTKRYFGRRRYRIIVVVIVLLVPMVIAIPMSIFSGTTETNVTLSDGSYLTKCSCEAKTEQHVDSAQNYLVFLFVLSLLLIITTTILYIPVGIVIFKKYKEPKTSGSQTPTDLPSNSFDAVDTVTSNTYNVREAEAREERREKSRRPNITLNFHMMFGVIVLTYLLTYIPTFAMLLVQNQSTSFWEDLKGWKLTILLLLRRFHLLSNVCNPFVYGYFDITFRSYYASMFRSLFCCMKSNKAICYHDSERNTDDTDC